MTGMAPMVHTDGRYHPDSYLTGRVHVTSRLAPLAKANQATRNGWAYFRPGGATSVSAPSAALSVVAPPVQGAYLAPGIAKAQELR
jgi:hypothetical protein